MHLLYFPSPHHLPGSETSQTTQTCCFPDQSFLKPDPHRQTGLHIQGRISADASDQPVPSHTCHICTAEHQRASVCHTQSRTSLCSQLRSCTSNHLSALLAFSFRIPDRISRSPLRRTADISSFQLQASALAFCCRNSGRSFR